MQEYSRPATSTLVAALAAGVLLASPGCSKSDSDKGTEAANAQESKTGASATTPANTPEPAAEAKKPPTEGAGEAPAPSGDRHPGLTDSSQAAETAPETFRARFETTKGDFVIEVTRKWSPRGADRFYNLIKIGFFDGVRFFRVVKGFMVQFGIHGDPAVNEEWSDANIDDDMVVKSNTRSYVTFAKTGAPNSRSTQIFINYADRNKSLDGQGFSPFGQVIEGMEVVDSLEGKYGEQPSQFQPVIQAQGNAFLDERFPELDHIKKATLVEAGK